MCHFWETLILILQSFLIVYLNYTQTSNNNNFIQARLCLDTNLGNKYSFYFAKEKKH